MHPLPEVFTRGDEFDCEVSVPPSFDFACFEGILFKKAYYLNDLKWPKIDKNCPIFPQFREEYHDFKAFCQQPYLAVSIEKKVTAISLFLLVILLKRFLAILELTKIVPGVGRAGKIVCSAKFHSIIGSWVPKDEEFSRIFCTYH